MSANVCGSAADGVAGTEARPADALLARSALYCEAADEIRRLRGIVGTALGMLELIASKMPPGASVRLAVEAECAAMRSAALTKAGV